MLVRAKPAICNLILLMSESRGTDRRGNRGSDRPRRTGSDSLAFGSVSFLRVSGTALKVKVFA